MFLNPTGNARDPRSDFLPSRKQTIQETLNDILTLLVEQIAKVAYSCQDPDGKRLVFLNNPELDDALRLIENLLNLAVVTREDCFNSCHNYVSPTYIERELTRWPYLGQILML